MKRIIIILLAVLVILSGLSSSAQSIVSIVAGNGASDYTGDGGPAIAASFRQSQGICFDGLGNLYFIDYRNCVVRKVDTTGIITTLAGTGVCGYSGDGGPASAAQFNAYGISCDFEGNLLIGDWRNQRIRKIDQATGVVTTIAGTGVSGYSGDGGLAVNANLGSPIYAIEDHLHNIYISDYGNGKIRKVDANGIITTLNAQVSSPVQLAIDLQNNILVAEQGGRIDKIDPITGNKITVAGGGADTTDGIIATNAKLSGPEGVAVDCHGNIIIANNDRNIIQKVDVNTGIITRIAGGGVDTPTFAGVSALNAMFHNQLIFFDSAGNLYCTSDQMPYIYKITYVSDCGPLTPDSCTNPPSASFSFLPNKTPIDTIISFVNTSANAARYLWDFGDGNTSAEINPTHFFSKSGYYNVCLTAYSGNMCKTSICRNVFTDVHLNIAVPTGFSPDGDGINDVLYVRGAGIKTIDLKIYNRFGQIVFQTLNVNEGWNGKYKAQDQPAEAYGYTLDVVFVDNSVRALKGNVSILR